MVTNSRIKKIITKKGNVMYYKGDGLWFGRTSKADAELGLATGQYILFTTVNRWVRQYQNEFYKVD